MELTLFTLNFLVTVECKLVKDFNILVGGNSITNCNTRSTKDNILPMDMGQLDVVVGVEGDVEVILGLGPLLVGGVSCPL